MKKILFICPYFGKYPNYFNLTLNSIKYNNTIDWLIITDIKAHYDYPDNVKVIYMTFSELQKKIQSCFDFKISLDRPYKLCDYKCAYGFIFKEFIQGYDFWGHCDFDAIYGNFRKFLSEKILNGYKKIYYLGHLSLYENNTELNNIFKLGIDEQSNYKKIFSDNKIYAFDELGIVRILSHNNIKIYNDFSFADIYTWDRPLKTIYATVNTRNKNMNFKIDKDIKQVFEFNQGKLYSHYLTNKHEQIIQTKEYMYIHLQRRFMNNTVSNLNNFLIVPNKFVDKQEITRDFILNHSKENILYKRYIKTRRSWNKRKSKIKKYISLYKNILR